MSSTATTSSSSSTCTSTSSAIAGATTSPSRRRIVWIPVNKKTKDGKRFHFICDENHKDKALFNQIALEPPFLAGHGMKMRMWDAIAFAIGGVTDSYGLPLFGEEGITGKACLDRFKIVMAWTKKFQAMTPFRSGNDDEEPPSALLSLIEESHELYNQHLATEEEKTVSKIAEQQKKS